MRPIQILKNKSTLHLLNGLILQIIVMLYHAQASYRLGEPKRTILDTSILRHSSKVLERKTITFSESYRIKMSLEKGANKIVSGMINYNKVKNSNANLVISPYSIQTAILIMSLGAQVDNNMWKFWTEYLEYDLKLDMTKIHAVMSASMNRLARHPEFILANLYIFNWLTPINRLFKETVQKYYPIEFDGQEPTVTQGIYSFPELSNRVNAWASNRTGNNVQQILSNIDISNFTYDYLLNLGHFQSDWNNMFKLERTKFASFYSDGNPNTAQNISFMNGLESLRYLDMREPDYNKPPYSYAVRKRRSVPLNSKCDCEMIEIPFRGGLFSMMILIPAQMDGFSKVQDIPLSKYREILYESRYQTIDLQMPKFYVNSAIYLKDVFQEHGMSLILKNKYHSGLTAYRRPFVETHVIHRNSYGINEQGANVFGAHVYKKKYLRNPTPLRNITVDRPFMFAVMETSEYMPLLVGQITRIT